MAIVTRTGTSTHTPTDRHQGDGPAPDSQAGGHWSCDRILPHSR